LTWLRNEIQDRCYAAGNVFYSVNNVLIATRCTSKQRYEENSSIHTYRYCGNITAKIIKRKYSASTMTLDNYMIVRNKEVNTGSFKIKDI